MLLGTDDYTGVKQFLEYWKAQSLCTIMNHTDKECCNMTKDWLFALNYSLLQGRELFSPPTWLQANYEWGPSKHPIYWCDLPHRNSLDCGALAALAHQLFQSRGVESFRVQLVKQSSQQDVRHWRERWRAAKLTPDWIFETLVYHEVCGIIDSAQKFRIWDPTHNIWVDPNLVSGYRSTQALRIAISESVIFPWGNHKLVGGEWCMLT